MKDEALSIDGQCVERLPIPHIPEPLADNIGKRTESILVLTKEIFSIHEETARIVEGLTGVKISPKELTDLPPSSILQRLKKQMIVRKIETRLLSQLESVLSESKARQVEKTKLQLSIERVLSGLVQDAYGISDEEGLLLRSTRPVRDPLDTLEDNIQGREVENDGI